MRYLTLVVPCYNSQAYMSRCIDSLLPGGEDVEIILVDDGSTDGTGELAEAYQSQYPQMIRVLHKPNGGHGSGVNAGLRMAEGLYFKVVDSDDWLDREAYLEVLRYLKQLSDGERYSFQMPDLIVCNYVYDHLEEDVRKTMRYRNVFPAGKLCTWSQTGRFGPSQYLVMHAQIFRTQVLRHAGVELPEHTFYVDNLFSCKPLPFVNLICYLDVDLYHYYLGREDQSVNEKVMIQRIDQLIQVTNLVAGAMDLKAVECREPKLARYLRRNLSIMMAMTSIHLLLMDSPEGLKKRTLLWEGLRQRDPGLYRRLRYHTLSGFTDLPGKLGGKITLWGYRLAKKLYHFQ